MSFEHILFYLFATVTVAAALGVVTVRNPVHAVLLLVLTFFSSAAIWLLAEAEFLAIALVLVYVGAVMVLFLFVVMMLDINVTVVNEGFARYLPIGATVAAVMVTEMGLILYRNFNPEKVGAAAAAHGADYSNTRELGRVLYTDYVLSFELAAVILLVGIIAAITLTLRRQAQLKTPNPGEQVKVLREDRIRLVKMKAEKKV